MKKYEYTAIGGEKTFSSDSLIGKTILSVIKDGVGYTKIVTTAPTGQQVQYTNYTGAITFEQTLEGGTYILVLYQDNGNVCFPVTIPDSFALPDANAGFPYNASFFINGTGSFSISSIVKPSWMTVSLSGNKVTFSGTPAIADDGTNTVTFTLTNACGTANFDQSFTITVLAAEVSGRTLVSEDRLTDYEKMNLSGTPGVVVTVTLDTLSNTNGGTLKVNGTVASEGDTFNVTLTTSGGSLSVDIDGVDNPNTVIRGHFTITAVSAGTIGLTKTYQISKIF